MALLLDPEAAWRDASCEPVAGADLRLTSATDFRCVFDDIHGDARKASRAAKLIHRGKWRIHFHHVFIADLPDSRTTTEVHVGAIENGPEFLNAPRPQLN